MMDLAIMAIGALALLALLPLIVAAMAVIIPLSVIVAIAGGLWWLADTPDVSLWVKGLTFAAIIVFLFKAQRAYERAYDEANGITSGEEP
jgi:membrane protein implicated in regulation of membrane protease activity